MTELLHKDDNGPPPAVTVSFRVRRLYHAARVSLSQPYLVRRPPRRSPPFDAWGAGAAASRRARPAVLDRDRLRRPRDLFACLGTAELHSAPAAAPPDRFRIDLADPDRDPDPAVALQAGSPDHDGEFHRRDADRPQYDFLPAHDLPEFALGRRLGCGDRRAVARCILVARFASGPLVGLGVGHDRLPCRADHAVARRTDGP